MRRGFAPLALSTAAVLAFRLLGQQTQPPSPTIKVDVRQVLVPVVVTDKEGHHVTGLTRADFKVFEDGVEQTITAFSVQSSGAAVGGVGRRSRGAAARSHSRHTGPKTCAAHLSDRHRYPAHRIPELRPSAGGPEKAVSRRAGRRFPICRDGSRQVAADRSEHHAGSRRRVKSHRKPGLPKGVAGQPAEPTEERTGSIPPGAR